MSKASRPVLYVEGKDDVHAIASLLQRHGVDTSDSGRRFDIKTVEALTANGTTSVEALLRSIPSGINLSRTQPVGFVIDTDQDLVRTWAKVCGRLRPLDVEYPEIPPRGGLIADVPSFKTTVGVWLMPNNADRGMLEDFLVDLVKEDDLLLPHAQTATDEAMKIDGRFTEIHRPKAVIHTWLAWQEKPGLPFGTAITAEYFRHDTETALAFVKWFRQLFGV